MGCRTLLLCCALLGWSGVRADARADLDAMFDDTMARYRLPGLAVGVITDGEVSYVRTAGELRAGEGKAIDRDTLFKIASNSKAMTTALLARLVDAGRLRWDDPVTRHLPAFRMHDPWVTREIQVRDLLIHNSGLGEGAGDLMLWPEPNAYTRADILAGLAHLKPTHSFRAHYSYDNLLYVVAGEVAAAAGGAPYETLLQREVFEPLGLARCRVGEFGLDAVGNVAQPHMREGDGNRVIREDAAVVPASTSAAAGGVRCSLGAMLRWARVWLDPDHTLPSGAPWLSPEQRRMLWTAHMPMPLSARQRAWDDGHFLAYGFGWRLSDVDGEYRVSHTGTLAGMYSLLTLLPDRRSGFVILINGDGSDARTVLGQALVKHFTAPGQQRGVAYYADALAAERAEASAGGSAPRDAAARAPTAPAALGPWLGVYRDPWFGEVRLCAEGERVVFRARKSPRLVGTVQRVGARDLVDWDDPSVDAEPWLAFAAADGGADVRLTLSHVDPQADFSYDYADLAFTRVRGCD
ncbi:serine hydrolase domain-containing protein [Chiayiivirga flava]|uniref:CubicO group peptidase (Beta-lactamase class C family) n=1 Tax=Chiayiivirga flava TaxID=659595 RepID=A0A7W8D8K4_9GAMM|nr:serine hydrolase domain-containing protein [Chiayiivirga flava]MBB5208770.1 CubicO group peptidase (beta-lactamase class C family) [Chiayiivirga flava]